MPLEFRTFIVNFILIGLVLIASISLGVNIAIDNGSNNTIISDEDLNRTFNRMSSNLTNAQNIMNDSRSSLDDELIEPPTGAFILTSIIGAGKSSINMATLMYNVTFGFIFKRLNISPIIIGVVSSIVILSLLFLAYKFWKTGS